MKYLRYDRLRLVSVVRRANPDANLGVWEIDATVAPVNHLMVSTPQDRSASSQLQVNVDGSL